MLSIVYYHPYFKSLFLITNHFFPHNKINEVGKQNLLIVVLNLVLFYINNILVLKLQKTKNYLAHLVLWILLQTYF